MRSEASFHGIVSVCRIGLMSRDARYGLSFSTGLDSKKNDSSTNDLQKFFSLYGV